VALLQKETCNLRHPMHLTHSHDDSLTCVLSVSLICVLRLVYFPVMPWCGNSHDAYTYTHWHTHTNTQGIRTRKQTHAHRSGARTPGYGDNYVYGDTYEKSCPGYGDTYVKSCLGWHVRVLLRHVRVLLRHVRVLLRHVRVLLTRITHVTIWVS